MKLENSHDIVCCLRSLLCIPHKILSFGHHDNLTAFVLHELCHDACLNLDRAAYFIDNPDFNCFKGISGIDRVQEEKIKMEDVWKNPDDFKKHMHNSAFNKKVRDVQKPSTKNQNEEDFINTMADYLSLHNHKYHAWDIKHGNRGYLLYEPAKNQAEEFAELMPYAVSLLAFCPIG